MAHSHEYARSFRRTVTWRWAWDRKLRKAEGTRAHPETRVDVVNLLDARTKGEPDRVVIKRILANLHGTGQHDVEYVQIISVDE